TGHTVRSVPMGAEVMALTVTSDGMHALVGTLNGDLSRVDLDAGKVDVTTHVADGWIHQIAIRPRSKVAAVAVNTEKDQDLDGPAAGFVAFVDALTLKATAASIPADHGFAVSLAWSPSGDRLAMGQINNE